MEYITYDEKKLQSFDYECSLNTGGNILGSCELGKATLQMINESNEYSSFKGKWISTPKGSFYIYNVEPVQEKVNIKLECYDIKYKLDTLYISSNHSFPCTLKEWRNSIFDECEVIYDNSDFPNSDLVLQTEPYVESGASNRQVISMIAQAGASFVITDKNDKFYFNWFTNIVHEITDWTELTTEKETSKAINCVVLGREGGDDYTYPTEQPNTPVVLRINNNYILDPQDTGSTTDLRSTTIVPIYERVNNFSFIKYSVKSEFVNNKLLIKLGDKVKYTDIWGNSLVSLVMSIKLSWLGNDWENSENYSVYLSADEISETSEDFNYAKNTKERLVVVERKTDKNAGKIEDTIKSVNDLEEKTTTLRLDLDRIEGEISEVADVSVTADGVGTVTLENVAGNSEPIYVKIRPTTKSLSLLYPSDDLFLSDDLFPLERYLSFKNGDYEITYRLPADLWFLDINTYDEFVLDYEKQKCYVIHRTEFSSAGILQPLENENIEYFDYPEISLIEGNYSVSLLGHETAFIYCRLMAKSIYTEQFATKIELNSKITQVNNEIDLSVSQLASNVDKEVEKLQGEINVQAGKVVLKADANGNIVKAELTADPEEGTAFNVKADNINFSGKNFNLTSDNMSITSTNFSVDKNGKLTAKEAEITGGTINLTGNGDVAKFTINDSSKSGRYVSISPVQFRWFIDNNNVVTLAVPSSPVFGLNSPTTSEAVTINPYYTAYKNSSNEETIRLSGSSGNISCVSLTQTSLEKHKMNIERYTDALNEIEKIDVYKYNLKVESKDTKKHIGFIIGDKYRYSKEITNNEDTGVDLYSMTSLCLQAIKEQQEIINNLQEKVSYLENQMKNDIIN